MRNITRVGLAVLFFLSIGLFAGSFSRATAKTPKVLEFDTMVGVQGALVGSANPIRGINGGGLAWTVGSASGELAPTGKLEVSVQGLVFAAGPNTGSNTIASFKAIVSCLDATGAVQNLSTGTFPATIGPAASGGGNAKIEATVSLPSPCIAPIVFVTSPGGNWFAATGN